MLKALKVTMIVYAIFGMILGIMLIVIPDLMRDWFRMAPAPDYIKYFLAVLGSLFFVMGAFYIMAARDLIQNILWVKFAIAEGLTGALVALYSLLVGYGDFLQMGFGLIIHTVFSILLLIFYPWKAKAED